MQILYLIGNGFDLNLGLRTSYKDFYNYYKSIESTIDSINKLRKNISSNYNNWSELELALGQYTDELHSIVEFDEVFENIGEELGKYLKNEENGFEVSNINSEVFFENLVKPEMFLSIADNNKIIEYKNNYSHKDWNIDIFTFNYTTIIEKIIGMTFGLNIGHHIRDKNIVTLGDVKHIHGFADKQMVLGVNDISQLKNKDFHQNIDVLEAIVKEKCNIAYGHTIDSLFKTKISQADFIVIFGSSLGDTDNIWWEQIGKRLSTSQIPLIIFTKGEEVISPRIAYKNNRTKRNMSNYFLKKTKLSKDEIEQVNSNIYVAIDTEMFKKVLKK